MFIMSVENNLHFRHRVTVVRKDSIVQATPNTLKSLGFLFFSMLTNGLDNNLQIA